jgi:glycosyltransferase involved in cell wall biosynthesis
MIRVLHASQPVEGGVARYIQMLADNQLSRGWEVSVACPPGELADVVRALGGRWLRWDAVRSPGPTVVREIVHLGGIMTAASPDVVHLHSSKAGLVGRLLLRGRRPTIFQPHGWSWQASPGAAAPIVCWERLAASWSSRLICVSNGEREAGQRAGVVGRYEVIRSGVDLTVFRYGSDKDRRQARRELHLPDDAPIAVCVARLCRQKGQTVLLDAWPGVMAAVPSAILVLVGDGEDRDVLAGRRLPGVRLVGAQKDVWPWYAASDVVVLPSQWGEGLALTPLEAMATGRSVVVTDVLGAREVVAPDWGVVVAPSSPHALAVAISRRLGDRALSHREGVAAARFAVAELDQKRPLESLASITLDLLHDRH